MGSEGDPANRRYVSWLKKRRVIECSAMRRTGKSGINMMQLPVGGRVPYGAHNAQHVARHPRSARAAISFCASADALFAGVTACGDEWHGDTGREDV